MFVKYASILLLGASLCLGALNNREPKFFFVSSSTSTSVTTTTSNLAASLTCLILTKTAYAAACPQGKRRKRYLNINDDSLDMTAVDIKASRVERSLPQVEDSGVAGANRDAKFAWYYMTTTLTSVSTSTSTSTTFSVTVSVTALNCTPSEFIACGGGGAGK